MLHTKKIASIIVSLLAISSVYAETSIETTNADISVDNNETVITNTSLEIVGAPTLVDKTSNSVTLTWNQVDAAGSYIVLYSKESVAEGGEDAMYTDESDPVVENTATIENLDSDTDYYFSVIAIDKITDKQSDYYSDELMVRTNVEGGVDMTGSTGGLEISSVSVIDDKTINVEFNANLSSDPVTLKITKTQDSSDVPVSSVSVDPMSANIVIVSIGTTLDVQSSYSLVVISATDEFGNNIEEGVSGIEEFTTPITLASSSSDTIDEFNAAGPDDSNLDMNSDGVLDGNTDSNTEVTNTGALGQTDELPATGTKENLIVFIALLLSFGIVYGYRKATAK